MSTETWGALNKALDDNETIEEAIARLIVAHLADADAHIESGESLYDHKQSAVIDHLADSVVTDKLKDSAVTSPKITTDQIVGKDIRTATDVGSGVDGVKMTSDGIEMWQSAEKKVDIPKSGNAVFKGNLFVNSLEYLKLTLQSNFGSMDAFDVTGFIDNYLGIMQMFTTSVLNNYSEARVYTDDEINLAPDITKNPIFDCTCFLPSSSSVDARVGTGTMTLDNGVGFQLTGSKVYTVWFEDDNTEHLTEIATIDPTDVHRYRVEIDDDVTIKWYVDGVLKQTLDASANAVGDLVDNSIVFYIKTLTAASKALYAYNVLYQQDF